MATSEELYQQACTDVAGIQTPELDPESRRIWILIGALSDALWRRVDEPGFSIFEHLCRSAQDYQAESEDEVAIWTELTAPQNYPAVVRFVELRHGQVNEYGAQLHATILEASRRRLSESPDCERTHS